MNQIRESECNRLNIPIQPLDTTDNHIPNQADGTTPMDIVGKATFNAQRGPANFKFMGYVSKNLNEPILCGGPFIEENKIVQELRDKRIVIENKYYIMETLPDCPNQTPQVQVTTTTETPGGARFPITKKPGVARLPTTDIEINIDANIPLSHKQKLDSLHTEYSTVIDSELQTAYNSRNLDREFNSKNSATPGVTPTVHLECIPPNNTNVGDETPTNKPEDQNIAAKVRCNLSAMSEDRDDATQHKEVAYNQLDRERTGHRTAQQHHNKTESNN